MITIDQFDQWKEQDILTVRYAATLIGLQLAPFTELPPYDSFSWAFGEVIVRYNPNLETPAYASGNEIEFRPEYVNDWNWVQVPLIMHEAGHLFNIRRELVPQKMLYASGLGKYLMRNRPFENGLQWLPSHLEAATPGEHWANLFGSWAGGLIASNVQGRAMLAFMVGNMPAWMSMI